MTRWGIVELSALVLVVVGLVAVIGHKMFKDKAAREAEVDCQASCYPQGMDAILDSGGGCHCFAPLECE